MRRRIPRIVTVGLALFAAALVPARVAEADPIREVGRDVGLDVGKGDVGLQADKLEIDVATGTALLTGQVVLTKGDLGVRCPKVELKFDSSPNLMWAKGSGGVAADVRGVHAEAPEVELDLRKQTLELRGGVKLSRGQGWIQAEKATIELATAKVTATQVKGSLPVPK
jgi:lipopolysaccharide export system protein LptA